MIINEVDDVPRLFPKWDNGEPVEMMMPVRSREWLSLTADEMMVFLFKHYNKDLLKALQEFEQVLKDKNGLI